jgi:hypothetical protein
MLMGVMGMFPMIAGIVGSTSTAVGIIVHGLISVFIGATFGLIYGSLSTGYTGYGRAALWGLVYGVIWWVLGPLIIMPLLLGMGVQIGAALSGPMLMSLMGHMIYGALTGIGFAWYVRGR